MEPCITAGTGIEETGFGYTMSLVSGKYKMIILYWLVEYSVLRYNELKRRLGTISHKTLSLSLKELEADGLVQREEYPQIPPKVEYSLSERGRSLIPILDAMCIWGEENRTRSRFTIEAVASSATEKQSGHLGPGGSEGYELFDRINVEDTAREAARIAVTMLGAKPCPAGKIPVVIDNGFGGVIFHEACGHGLEATAVARNASVFAGRLGQQIASPLVTALDDGTIPNGWGSAEMDDEGTPTAKNILIENGILRSYLVDRLNSRRMHTAITGSSRRQDYRFAPTSRMTNTFIANGKSTPEEIIANTEFGLYAKQMGGGSVDPATGSFNFAVLEGYMIRNGRIAEPVRGATLIGKGAEVLRDIDMVGNNLKRAQGMCGSKSGSIPTDVGQPMIRVSSMTVGGRG